MELVSISTLNYFRMSLIMSCFACTEKKKKINSTILTQLFTKTIQFMPFFED